MDVVDKLVANTREAQTPFRGPQVLFLAGYAPLKARRQPLFDPEFRLELSDLLVLVVGGFSARPGPFEGRDPSLKEKVLPWTEQGRNDVELITEIGNRGLFEQMPPQNAHLLLGREVLSFFETHGIALPLRVCEPKSTYSRISGGKTDTRRPALTPTDSRVSVAAQRNDRRQLSWGK